MKKLMLITCFSLISILFVSANDLTENFITGSPQLSSIKAIAFGPQNILFIGDNTGMKVVAVQIPQNGPASKAGLNVPKLGERFAASMGVSKSKVHIEDMAVNPTTKQIFWAVRAERGDQSVYALFTLDAKGLRECPLESVRYSQQSIEDAPEANHKTWKRPSRTYTITDLHYTEGEVIISGLSNEEFSSSLRRVGFPFNKQSITTNLQVYHVSHGRNETHAPIYRFKPVSLQGEWHIVAGYMCTPLVTFRLKELNGTNKLVGKTVAEIGAGNTPTGIITYQYNDQHYILIGNNVHPLTKLTGSDLFQAKSIQAPSKSRGVRREQVQLGSIAHISDFDAQNIVLIVYDKASESYSLKPVNKADI